MLKNLSIKKKLLLIMGIPLLILILFTAKLMFSSYQDWSTLKKLEHVVILSTKIGSFVHETQKERGMTAGFLGSKGAKFSTKLPLQRQLTNKKKEEFVDFLSTFNKQNYGKEFNKSLNIAEKQLTKLSEIRKKVSGLNISTKQAIAYYTNLNSYLLNTISSITKLSTNAEISQDLVSYLNFLLSKERAGIERAVGTNTFARDNFGPGMKAKFYTLVAEQNAYMDSFLKVTNDFSKRFYFNTLKGNAVEEVNRMRHIALFEKNQAFGVDASYWFKTITSKINLLKKVENYLEATLTRSIRNEKQKAQNDLLLFGLVSFISILFTLYLAKIIAFKILNDLYTLKDGLLNFFSFLNFETKEIQSINLNSSDELGEMACAINDNIKKTQDNLKLDKELIDDTISIAGKINKGYLDVNISKESNNPLLSELKTIINEMLNTLNVNISNVMNVLNSYSKLDYRPKLETNDLEGIIKDLEQDVDILRDSITQTLIQNKKDGLVLEQNSKLLSQNMNDISLAANQQAASLEETAASLEEITSNITNNTQTAAQMLEYGSKVKSSVSTGQELANKTALSMDEINTQTTAITEAITVIDQIAFQTNILSLNAAVEAATAGEAGKGFAVVAQEVRNLASRSAEAAKEIKDIVETAQTKASEGKSIADNMIEGYNSLNEDITNTLSLIENVANASNEQSQGINQINDTINKLDHITQENAQHASMADNIATKTADIAQVIVQNANAKEFEGKDNISVRKEVINESYQGIEKRQVERKIKKIPEYNSKKVVEENSNSNDEWESF